MGGAARCVFVDSYGNALTGLRAAAPTFSAVPVGEGFRYENSNGLVGIAFNQGRADRALGLAVGSTVEIEP